MSELVISCPGGVGIHWLMGVIYCLENSCYMTEQDHHFHKYSKPANVKFNHDHTDTSAICLNGAALFNIYLNVIKKFRIVDRKFEQDSLENQFEMMASEASSKLFFFNKNTDISYDDLMLSPDKFTSQLYQVLDQYKRDYKKNNDIVSDAISKFKLTCVDPVGYFDNFDNKLWLGWCLGISKHLYKDFPIIPSIEHAHEFLYPRKDFFTEYTKDKVIFFNAK